MDYIMINRYRTLVRIRCSAFVDVKYVKKYADWKSVIIGYPGARKRLRGRILEEEYE